MYRLILVVLTDVEAILTGTQCSVKRLGFFQEWFYAFIVNMLMRLTCLGV